MVEKITKYKKYILGIAPVIMLLTLFFGINNLMKNKNNESLPEVKLKEKIEKEKTFAIMISDDGSNYKKYENNEWPNDKYKFKEAKCADNNGNLVDNAVTFDSVTKTVILETDRTISCTMYFDKKTTMNILRENDTNKNLSEDLQGGMYRYQGTNDVANWICFGTTDNCDTDETDNDGNSIPDGIDKYMYRIIGITAEGEMKLIKETFIKEDTSTSFAWNDRYYVDPENERYCTDGKCPDWPDSQIFKRLNGTSNGTEKGSGSTLDKEWTDIFVDSEKYDYLRSGDNINGGTSASEWYNLIAEHQWLYGDTNDTSALYKYNGDAMYEIESGAKDTTHYIGTKGNITSETYNWKDNLTLTAKIGLMYWYDYYYSYYDGIDESTRGNAGAHSKLTNAWLHFKRDGYNTSPAYEWLMTRRGLPGASSPHINAFAVDRNGDWYSGSLNIERGVRPIFYLESRAKIFEGDGTKNSPFIINY